LSLVETKEDRNAIGMCGIIKRDNMENPDIGFALLPASYGKGYAVEIANATLSYAIHELGIPKVAAITLPGNIKSIKLLERIGFKLIKTINSDNNEELLLYSN
jgi:RimJ/RimL family protein N-acetyltransferase